MWKIMLDYSEEEGWYKIVIKGQLIVPKDVMKVKLLSSGNIRLAALDYVREMIQREALWYSCPEWELDYGITYK